MQVVKYGIGALNAPVLGTIIKAGSVALILYVVAPSPLTIIVFAWQWSPQILSAINFIRNIPLGLLSYVSPMMLWGFSRLWKK